MKTFPVVLKDEFHYELKTAALKAHITMHEFIVQAIREKLDKEAKK